MRFRTFIKLFYFLTLFFSKILEKIDLIFLSFFYGFIKNIMKNF